MIGISGGALLTVFFMEEIPFGSAVDENYGLIDEKKRKAIDEEKRIAGDDKKTSGEEKKDAGEAYQTQVPVERTA